MGKRKKKKELDLYVICPVPLPQMIVFGPAFMPECQEWIMARRANYFIAPWPVIVP